MTYHVISREHFAVLHKTAADGGREPDARSVDQVVGAPATMSGDLDFIGVAGLKA